MDMEESTEASASKEYLQRTEPIQSQSSNANALVSSSDAFVASSFYIATRSNALVVKRHLQLHS